MHGEHRAAVEVENGHSSEVSEMTLQQMKTSVMKFWKDEEGLTVVEYAVAGGLIALVLIVAFQTLGTTVEDIICQINDELATGSGAGAACA